MRILLGEKPNTFYLQFQNGEYFVTTKEFPYELDVNNEIVFVGDMSYVEYIGEVNAGMNSQLFKALIKTHIKKLVVI